jgi:hypothetical protein
MNYDDYRQARANFNKAKNVAAKARKAGDMARDVTEHARGVRVNTRRKRFWEKKPFQNAVAALAIMGGTYGAVKYGPKLANKVLLAQRARILYLRNKGHTIEFGLLGDEFDDARDAGWQVRNPTGTSIKIQRSGRKKRERRKKTTSETTAFKNKLIAGLGAGLVGTAGLGAYLAMLTRKRGKLMKATGTKTNLRPTLTKEERAILDQAKARGSSTVPFKDTGTHGK